MGQGAEPRLTDRLCSTNVMILHMNESKNVLFPGAHMINVCLLKVNMTSRIAGIVRCHLSFANGFVCFSFSPQLFVVVVWNFELYMIPMALLLPLAWNYILIASGKDTRQDVVSNSITRLSFIQKPLSTHLFIKDFMFLFDTSSITVANMHHCIYESMRCDYVGTDEKAVYLYKDREMTIIQTHLEYTF